MPTPTAQTADPSLDAGLFWYRHRREIVIAIILLLVGAAGFGVYRLYASQRANQAATQLAAANSVEDYRKVISEFGGTPAGASAALLLAGRERIEGKFAEAN